MDVQLIWLQKYWDKTEPLVSHIPPPSPSLHASLANKHWAFASPVAAHPSMGEERFSGIHGIQKDDSALPSTGTGNDSSVTFAGVVTTFAAIGALGLLVVTRCAVRRSSIHPHGETASAASTCASPYPRLSATASP